MTCDKLLLPTMRALRSCTAYQVGACHRPVCSFHLYYSEQAMPATQCDCTCDQGGQGIGWVRLNQLSGASSSKPAVCAGGSFTATYEIGLHRCALTMDTMHTPITQDQRDEHTAGMLADAGALRRAPQCCAFLADNDLSWQLQSVSPLGPQGGCVATTATIQVDYVDCGGCS